MKSTVIGVDVGGTKIAAHISDGTLWHTAETTIATPDAARPAVLTGLIPGSEAHTRALDAGRSALLATIITLCQSLRGQVTDREIVAVGIGSAGQIDPVNGVVLDANENIVGWRGATIAETVGDALDLPVYVDNDVRVMALAETTLGAAQEYRHVLCITVGTGIGGAIVIDGRLWHGGHFSAGEIGYIYGADGQSIEGLYAGPAIERRYGSYTLREIADRAKNGDTTCIQAIQDAARQLGLRIAPVLALLDPQALVVGGGVPQIGALWWEPFVAALREAPLGSVREMPVLRAQFGNRAGMIGAAVLAMQKVKQS